MKRVACLFLLLLFLFLPAVAHRQPPAACAEDAPDQGYTAEELLSMWYQIGSVLRENGLYPFVELQKGDRGYEVRALQIRLAELYYYNKALADNFGSGTYAAMRSFESVNGLRVDGIASVEDQKRLFSPYALASTGAQAGPPEAPQKTPAPDSEGGSGIGKWLLPNVRVSFKPIPTATPKPEDEGGSSGGKWLLPDVKVTFKPIATATPTPKPALKMTLSPLVTKLLPLGAP